LSLTNAAGDFPQPSLLEDSLLESDRYQVVYQTATVLIFSRR
jgi:hypothetical protein